ncbi:hypothetical protein ASG11_03665 [Sphingomonas sp. Leaf357]|uniref:hypothetical protein n=1 Tax=Sphingomonas sp. Leaf357 TaxID=1736350 RepID=UPI0006F38DC4|nr:hypothetical protein [Sphingomonas sp. Leaf357]KQS03470.1 hypothetical protein ASG11_03665 [Sphingomonas sp. Leaf357]
MTTYPLSESATIYSVDASGAASSDILGQGTLEDCVAIVAGLSADKQKSISIQMDSLDLQFGPQEAGELLHFLREESAGLSNNEIIEIKSSDL